MNSIVEEYCERKLQQIEFPFYSKESSLLHFQCVIVDNNRIIRQVETTTEEILIAIANCLKETIERMYNL